jgi:hypothetical protein
MPSTARRSGSGVVPVALRFDVAVLPVALGFLGIFDVGMGG